MNELPRSKSRTGLLPLAISGLILIALPATGWASADRPNPGPHVTTETTLERVMAGNGISIDDLKAFMKNHHRTIGLDQAADRSSSQLLSELLVSGRLFLIDSSGQQFAAHRPMRATSFVGGTLYIERGFAMTDNETLAGVLIQALQRTLHHTSSPASGQGCAVFVAPGVTSEQGLIGTLQPVRLGTAHRLTVIDPSLNLLSYNVDPIVVEERFGLCGRLVTALASADISSAWNGRVILGGITSSEIGDGAVNQGGRSRARRLVTRDGLIILDGGDKSTERGVPIRRHDHDRRDSRMAERAD